MWFWEWVGWGSRPKARLSINMAGELSFEYRTVASCSNQLETALLRPSRDLVYFLHREGFITQEVCDDVLNARSILTDHDKAGGLVAGIRNKVKLRAQDFHTFMGYLRQGGKYYESIVGILETEYTRQQQSTTGHGVQALQDLSPVLTRFRKYLKSCYKNYSIARDDKLSIAPCSQFIRLALIQKSKDSEEKEEHLVKTPLALNALVTSDSRFVLVKGPSGIGKSTICWELCKRWGTLESLQRFKIVLLLKLREKHVQNATELSEIFLHWDKKLCQSVVDEVCEGEGVLLILDGVDELPKSLLSDRSSLIMELIGGTCLPEATRLVTSQPSVPPSKFFPGDHRHVEILGFTDECKVEYAEVAFKSEPDVCEHFKTFIISNPTINSMMNVPIYCAIIAQVFKDIRKSGKQLMPKTMTQLYTTLVLVLIRRHMIGKGQWGEDSRLPSDLKSLPADILAALENVSKLAHRGLLEIETQLVFSDEDVGEGFQHLGLLSEAKEMYVMEGAKSSYSFPHLSIQRFLAAYHHSSSNLALPKNYFSVIDSNSLFPYFLAGFMGCTELSKNAIVSHARDMIPFLYEAQDSCVAYVDHVFPDYLSCAHYCPSSPMEMWAFGYVLVHAQIKWELVLNALSSLSQLVAALANHQQMLGTISKLVIKNFWTLPSISKIGELPVCLLTQIKELTIEFQSSYVEMLGLSFQTGFHHEIECVNDASAQLLTWISSLQNLETLSLSGVGSFQDSHLLYEAISSCPELKQFLFSLSSILTVHEIKQIASCIASSQSLLYVKLMYESSDYYLSSSDISSGEGSSTATTYSEVFLRELELRRLVESTLSYPTLRRLDTNIPFFVLSDSVSRDLVNIIFYYSPYSIWSDEVLDSCLCCIADICKIPSMKSVNLHYCGKCDYLAPGEIFPIFNNSLRLNPSFDWLHFYRLHLSSNYQRSTLSNSFRTHPSLLSLKRSYSLQSLSLSDDFTPENASHSTDCIFWSDSIRPLPKELDKSLASYRIGSRWQSCPDLVQMQSLHAIHPALFKALKCKELYYDKQRWDVYYIVHSRTANPTRSQYPYT